MAGAKETPRQKMINLMYLVLLAMLALQVSSAIIQKFHFLNASMELANDASDVKNNEMFHRMELAVAKAKNNPEDVKVLNSAKELRKETGEMKKFIRDLKTSLIEQTGGVDENGNYNGAKEEEKVAVMMLGPGEKKSGEGYALQTKLNTYVKSINDLLKKQKIDVDFDKLALDGKEDPIFKDDPEQRNKDFAQLNFEATPMIAALAVLTEKEANINAIETEALSMLQEKVTGRVLPIDRVRPVVMTNTARVVAGTEYEADMFMAAYASSYKPKMTFGTKELDVDGMGAGKIKFKAGASTYKDGLAKKTWKGTITYPKAGGGDSVYTVEQEYYVVEPVIKVQSATMQTLYKGCANEMVLDCPALGADYNPSISASGAQVINTSQKGKVKVVPSAPNVKVKVKSNGVEIGAIDYKVRLIPKPTVKVTVGSNKEPNPIQGNTKSEVGRLKLKVIPDPMFAQTNPADAKYRVKKWKLTHVSGTRGGRTMEQSGNIPSLRNFLKDAKSGDRIIVEALKIERKNFRGGVEEVNMPKTATTFQVIIR